MSSSVPPPSFMCPISRELMDDPVMCTDGHSYDRKNIARWLTEHDTSPATGAPLASTVLLPNIALRNAIEEWEDAQQQWEQQQREQEHRARQQQAEAVPQALRVQPPPVPEERDLDPGSTSPSTQMAAVPTSPHDRDAISGSNGGSGGDDDGSKSEGGGVCRSPSAHGEASDHMEPLEVGSPVLYTDSQGAEQRAQVLGILEANVLTRG